MISDRCWRIKAHLPTISAPIFLGQLSIVPALPTPGVIKSLMFWNMGISKGMIFASAMIATLF
jgi:hypothetical protein